MRNSRIISKVIGFRELVDERFQSGDLFVAQILLDIRTIAAGDFHDVFVFAFWRYGFSLY